MANAGPDAATGVSLNDTVSGTAGFIVTSMGAPAGSCDPPGTTVTCALGSIPADGFVTVTITVTRPAAAS